MGRFDEKVMFITGGGSGIGRATAIRGAEEGAKVVIYGRNQEKQEAVVAEITEAGGCAECFLGDVSDEETTCKAVKDTAEKYGKIDILVNCAGVVSGIVVTHENPTSQWYKVLECDLLGCYYTAKTAIPYMLEQKSGSIVNISSTTAIRPVGIESAYTSAKAAVIQFSKTMAQEYAGEGIRVNCVCPGLIDTDILRFITPESIESITQMIPMHRLGRPEELAALILFLASDDASYMTGSVVVADGGLIV